MSLSRRVCSVPPMSYYEPINNPLCFADNLFILISYNSVPPPLPTSGQKNRRWLNVGSKITVASRVKQGCSAPGTHRAPFANLLYPMPNCKKAMTAFPATGGFPATPGKGLSLPYQPGTDNLGNRQKRWKTRETACISEHVASTNRIFQEETANRRSFPPFSRPVCSIRHTAESVPLSR